MSTEISQSELKAYKEDSRIACQYGEKCYQKNPTHKKKYKHPPRIEKKSPREETIEETGTKRKLNDCHDDIESDECQLKHRKTDVSPQVTDAHSMSPSSSSEPESTDANACGDLIAKSSEENDCAEKNNETMKTPHTSSSKVANNSEDTKEIISQLFLFDMPDDFYKFYDFCTSISANDPTSALKVVDLKLVGPFDVLNGMIKTIPEEDDDKHKYLRHWRYFYDPPEFQTILKGNDKQGLHYGYWRDDSNGQPIFVGKNLANTSCKVIPVASNIFGAVKFHIDERLKFSNPFDQTKITRLSKMLIAFAKEHGINIEKNSKEMCDRERKVVAKTFHGAGIVVPYDKKIQLGYRKLAATDSQLQKILENIEKAEFEEVKIKYMSDIEEIVRMAAIAADECDFGTALELGHDLFSSGIESLQKTALHMFSMAYSLLHRPQFLKIAEAHMKNRKKGSNLSIL